MSSIAGDDSLRFLLDAFPGLDVGIIEAVLASCDRDLDRAMEVLFEMSAGEEAVSSPPSNREPEAASFSSNSASPNAAEEVDADLRMAMELQAQFDKEDADDSDADEDREDLPSMEDDERLARELALDVQASYAAMLQNEEFKQSRQEDRLSVTSTLSGTHNISAMFGRMDGGVGRGGARGGEGVLSGLLEESGVGMSGIQALLTETAIPAIEEAVREFDVPEIEEEVTVPRLGDISFGCSGTTMEEFTIPAEHLTVKIDGDNVRVTASHIRGRLSKFDWYYEQSKFPKLKDSGSAKAKIEGASIDVSFRISDLTGISVTDCQVKAGKVKVSVSGSSKSIIYNVVLATVVRVLKGQVESSLADLVRNVFE